MARPDGKKQLNCLMTKEEYRSALELGRFLSGKFDTFINMSDLVRIVVAYGLKHKDELEMK